MTHVGETGRIVGTGYLNHAMPLLRTPDAPPLAWRDFVREMRTRAAGVLDLEARVVAQVPRGPRGKRAVVIQRLDVEEWQRPARA